ncbi:MAG: Fe-S cluster assembly protein SufB, partial [Candidatus Zixiibacteriota bacterium]
MNEVIRNNNIATIGNDYASKYGFHDPEEYFHKGARGINHEVVEMISKMKKEPQWMNDFRHRALDIFLSKPMPKWGDTEILNAIDFANIFYYIKPTGQSSNDWDDVPEYIKKTFDKLGIPEAEKKFLAGVSAQYESEVVYHSFQEDLEKQGVIFLDMDSGLREHPDIVKKYFATIIPAMDNKFAALNSAVWSGGSFIYVPPGIDVKIPLQAYFRINAENMGQFERTLIIADKGARVHYIEGCTAPIWTTDSLHSAVVEVIALDDAYIRYTTIQNWSNNVLNLVTKRAVAHKNSTVEWVDGNIGSRLTMKYPCVYL